MRIPVERINRPRFLEYEEGVKGPGLHFRSG